MKATVLNSQIRNMLEEMTGLKLMGRQGSREGSVAKNICCSRRGAGFSS